MPEAIQKLEVRQWTWYSLPFCVRLPSILVFNQMSTWAFVILWCCYNWRGYL